MTDRQDEERRCEHVQEAILAWFDEPREGAAVPPFAAHFASCPSCAAFWERQQALDARLQGALAPPSLSPAFRAALRARLRDAPRHVAPQHVTPSVPRAWQDALPDIVHFASFAVATLACAAVLPFDAVATLGAGTLASLLTYVLLTAVRDSLEEVDLID